MGNSRAKAENFGDAERHITLFFSERVRIFPESVMPCIPINPGGFICCNHSGRLRLGNRYIWLEFHKYCGPTFYRDADWSDEYIPADEHDPIWPLFYAWLERRKLV